MQSNNGIHSTDTKTTSHCQKYYPVCATWKNENNIFFCISISKILKIADFGKRLKKNSNVLLGTTNSINRKNPVKANSPQDDTFRPKNLSNTMAKM